MPGTCWFFCILFSSIKNNGNITADVYVSALWTWLVCSQLFVFVCMMSSIAKSSHPDPKWACNQFSGQWTISILYTIATPLSTDPLQKTQKGGRERKNAVSTKNNWMLWIKAQRLLSEAVKVKKTTRCTVSHRCAEDGFLCSYSSIYAYSTYAEYNVSADSFISLHKHMHALVTHLSVPILAWMHRCHCAKTYIHTKAHSYSRIAQWHLPFIKNKQQGQQSQHWHRHG